MGLTGSVSVDCLFESFWTRAEDYHAPFMRIVIIRVRGQWTMDCNIHLCYCIYFENTVMSVSCLPPAMGEEKRACSVCIYLFHYSTQSYQCFTPDKPFQGLLLIGFNQKVQVIFLNCQFFSCHSYYCNSPKGREWSCRKCLWRAGKNLVLRRKLVFVWSGIRHS